MEAPAAAPTTGRPIYWWHVRDLHASGFVEALNAAGPDNRLEFDPNTKLFHVRVASGGITTQSHEGDDGFNYAHVCPPSCP